MNAELNPALLCCTARGKMLAGQTTSKMVQSHQLHASSSQPLEPAIPQKAPRMLMASLLNHSFLPQLDPCCTALQGSVSPAFREQLEPLCAASSGSLLCSRSFADLAGPQPQLFWIAGPSFWPEAKLFSSQPGETEWLLRYPHAGGALSKIP